MWELEKMAFYDGYYKAFAFGAYPCISQSAPLDVKLQN